MTNGYIFILLSIVLTSKNLSIAYCLPSVSLQAICSQFSFKQSFSKATYSLSAFKSNIEEILALEDSSKDDQLKPNKVNQIATNYVQRSSNSHPKSRFVPNTHKTRNSAVNFKATSFRDREKELDRVLASCRSWDSSASSSKSYRATLHEINHAITTAGRLLRVDNAIEMFNSIPKLGHERDLVSYNNIIWSCGNAGRVEVAKTFFTAIEKEAKLVPNAYSYGAMMHAYAHVKGYKQALQLLNKMENDGIPPNMVVFTSAMEACAEAGKHREALQVMEKVDKSGMKPDLTMVNTAIKACSLAGDMDEAERVAKSLRDVKSMDLFTYHTLMMGNTKLGRYSRVLSLYEEALQSTAQLDGGIYSLAMLAAFNSQLYTLVPKISDRAHNAGVQLTEASYTTLIQAYSELGWFEQAVQCLDVMEKDGLRPNVISYAAAMAACRNSPEVVIQLLQRLEKEGIEPNTVLLTSAINSLARGGEKYAKLCFNILNRMETRGPEPNIFTYNTVVRVLAESGNLTQALQLLDDIKSRNLKPDLYTFTTLLIACGRKNSSNEVDMIMQTMRDAGVRPDEIAYGAALDAHRRAGNSLKALGCLQEMLRMNLEPAPIHYNLLMRTLKAEGHTERMFKMAMAMSRGATARLNSNTFELVMEALLAENKWSQTLQIIVVMEKHAFKPSVNVCVQLIGLLEKARQYRAALAMYRYMLKLGYEFYENNLLNEIFKRLLTVASVGTGDLKKSAALSLTDLSCIELLEEAISSS